MNIKQKVAAVVLAISVIGGAGMVTASAAPTPTLIQEAPNRKDTARFTDIRACRAWEIAKRAELVLKGYKVATSRCYYSGFTTVYGEVKYYGWV